MLRRLWARHVYMPLAQRLQGEVSTPLREQLEMTQWLPAAEIRTLQQVRLGRLVRRLWERLPFHRERLRRAGWEPAAPIDLETFRRLPLLTKPEAVERRAELEWPDQGEGKLATRTTGSTGIPLEVLHTRTFRAWHEAGQWRARGWFGVDPGDPVWAAWGRPIDTEREKRILALKSALQNIVHVSAFDLTPRHMPELWASLASHRPALLYGYPSALAEVARYGRSIGAEARNLGIRVIMTTAEMLFPHQREVLEDVFGAPVSNVYGCAEFGAFAHECPQGRIHVADENVLVEYVDDQGRPVPAGTPGRVVVTSLHNLAMPLVRYLVGDVAVPLDEPCPCGRGLSAMDVQAGRVGEMVHVPGGQMFASTFFDHILKQLLVEAPDGIREFRVVQEALDAFEVEVVPGSGDLQEAKRRFVDHLKGLVEARVEVRFREVGELSRDPAGKMRYFLSKVAR